MASCLKNTSFKESIGLRLRGSSPDGEGGPVVEPEGGVVDVALLGLEVAGEASERTIHGEAVGVCTLRPKLKTMISRACEVEI